MGANRKFGRSELENMVATNLYIYHELFNKFDFRLVEYNPNTCMGKDYDSNGLYYSYFDLLFVKMRKNNT